MATGSKPPGNASWVVGTFVFLLRLKSTASGAGPPLIDACAVVISALAWTGRVILNPRCVVSGSLRG